MFHKKVCYKRYMELDVKYRGKVATQEDVCYINKLILENPDISRRALSQKLCKAWNWVQANGKLRDMVCRGFLLQLDSAGYIKLPVRKRTPHNPLVSRKKPEKIEVDQSLFNKKLSDIVPLKLEQVRNTPLEKLYNSLIEHHHYLGYTHPVGEHLKYIVFNKERPIACFSFSSPSRHHKSRDNFIGWRPDVRKKNLHFIAYNNRFLILPWIRVKFLASHLLSVIAKRLPLDWQEKYNHPIFFLETFVDTEKFKGTCYQAANWKYLGLTTGRGGNDHTNRQNRSLKAVFGYPLCNNFKEELKRC